MNALSRLALSLLFFFAAGANSVFAQPAPPVPLSPIGGESVEVPASLLWSAVLDPGAMSGGYNFQVSPSPGFSPLVRADSTNPATPEGIVSGLPPGVYFWRVQAVNGAGQASAWSPPESFAVTGAGPGTPGTPVLAPTRGYSTFHPWESIHFSWSLVPDAPTYRLEIANDPAFPLGTSLPAFATFWNENIRTTEDGFVWHPSLGEGRFFARVFAVASDFAGGVRSLPSNVIAFTVFYSNPIGPPPVLLSPVSGETLTLPITLAWAHVPNPQASGYVLELSRNASFSSIEFFYNQYTDPRAVLTSLSSGTKFWRVLSSHGLSSPETLDSPGTVANTAWSATGTFTLSSAPARLVSLTLTRSPVYSGAEERGVLQLSAVAPAGGAAVALSSSVPSALPVPASSTIPAGIAYSEVFGFRAGQVTSPTPVRVTATHSGSSVFADVTVMPPTLNDDPLQSGPVRATGGAAMLGWVDLEGFGVAPPEGVTVDLSTDSPFASVPAAVTIPAGAIGTSFPITTAPVTGTTTVTISARHGADLVSWPITLTASPAPTSLLVQPMSTTLGSRGIVTASEGLGHDQLLAVASSRPDVASVPGFVTVSAGSGLGRFDITTSAVTVATPVTISVTGGGVTLTHPLTIYPALPLLTGLTVAPSSVTGGASATGTVTLNGPAPTGGAAVNLGTSLPGSASAPGSVIVPGGARSATFPVTTFPVHTTTVQVAAVFDGAIQFAAITVNRPPAAPALSSVAVNPASVAGGGSSTGTVTLSAAAPAGGAVVTLSDNSAVTAVPGSCTVLAGATSATFTINTSTVGAPATATITAAYGGAALSATLSVTTGPPPAPTLLSPANDARPSQPVTFDWTDVSGGATYTIEIDDSTGFTAPLVRTASVSAASQATLTGLPAQRLFWRVRGVNATGVAGAWSSTRRFQPRAAPAEASLSSVGVSPARVVGGSGSVGTVALTSGAPTGGAVVALSSSNAGVASVPATVTVPSGAAAASLPVSTLPVASSATVTITAAHGGVTRTTTLAVDPVPPPAGLSSVALSPATVAGGSPAQATVTLTGAAPAGGIVVALSSAAGAVASVPASVTVPAGSTSAPFPVATSAVAASTSVAISAEHAGTIRSATLTVTPSGSNPPPAPSLLLPANDARFSPNQTVLFDWSDVAGAATYTIEIDDSESFAEPLVRRESRSTSSTSTSTLPTRRLWWRVRAVSSSGAAGNWSSVRRIEVKS